MLQKSFALFYFIAIFLTINIKADDLKNITQQQFQKEKDIIKSNKSSIDTKKSVVLQKEIIPNNTYKIFPNEKPCFQINNIVLEGLGSDGFQSYLDDAIDKIGFNKQCLGRNSIGSIVAILNNNIINAGYTTTKVIIPSQNLKSGTLKLSIISGKIDKILFNTNDRFAFRAKLKKTSAFPFLEGKILNMRDIEQGLENLSKDTSVKTNIQIVPSDKVNYSNVLIDYSSDSLPIKVKFTIDDTGSENTGKYQGGASLYLYNPLALNDLLYGGVSKNLLKSKTTYLQTPEGEKDKKNGKTNNFYFGYSVPFGPFLFDYYENKYKYEQAVAGAYQIYKYSGTSSSRSIKLSYLFHRNQTSKYNLYLKGWERSSKNFIEDAQVDNQRRKTAGYELGLSYEKTNQNSTLRLETALKKGTGARGALRAPEEEFGEGTSHMTIYTFDLSYSNKLFKELPIKYNGDLHIQLNGTSLTSQDKMGIGGRYTVRGFDGDLSLSSEKGGYLRNTFSYFLNSYHQIYLGLDVGHVFGKDSKNLVGKTLVGAALGAKGSLNTIGSLSYDLFIGTPIYKPKQFHTKKIAFGFSLSYDF